MRSEQFLIPEYLERFTCKGSLCEDTCCSGWMVPIDKKNYKRYKKLTSKKSKIFSENYLILNKNSTQALDYGYIKMKDNGDCPYLSCEQLCKIQLEFGEEALSYTCFSYPRKVNKINDIHEMSGSVACPEIAKLVLLNEEAMEFNDVFLNINRSYIASLTIDNTNDHNEKNDYVYHFWPLRIFTIKVLQDRRYSLSDRLILLGLVYKKIEQLSIDKKLDKTVPTINTYDNLFDDVEQMRKMLEGSPLNKGLSFSAEFLKEFTEFNGAHVYTATKYFEILRKIIHALGIDKDDFSSIEKNYNIAYEKYYAPYMHEKEYILENYLVNEVFKEIYPLNNESIDTSYRMLLTLYNVIKFHLVGLSSFYEELNDTIVVNTIQAFSRAVLHHKDYLRIFDFQK